MHSRMRKSSTLDSSDSSGTSIFIGNSNTTIAPFCGLNVTPNIDDIQQYVSPYLRKFDKLDAAIDVKFPNNLVLPHIFTNVLSGKISDSSIRDLCTCCWMNLEADSINILEPQFFDLGHSRIDELDKVAGPLTPITTVVRPTDVTRLITLNHILGKSTVVGDAVNKISEYNYKTNLEIWRENKEFELQKNTRS